MSSNKKNDSFSFDDDPGKLLGKDNADFTFTDIPVLGKNHKKELFSFDDLPQENEETDPTIASFEALLAEQPTASDKTQNSDDISALEATASVVNVKRMVKSRGEKKKKKQIIIMVSMIAVVILTLIAVVLMLLKSSTSSTKNKGIDKIKKKLSPAEKAKNREQKGKAKITALLKSANSTLAAGEIKEALSSFQRIISLDKKESAAYVGVGNCYEKLQNIKAAKENYQKAIDVNPKNASPYNHIARLLIKSKKIDQAKELLEVAHKKLPTNTAISLSLANIYYDMNEKEKALEIYNAVNDRDSFSEEAIQKYTPLLKETSRKKAEELLLYCGEKFKNASFYISASQLTDTLTNKVKVLKKALKTLPSDNPDIAELKFLMTEALIKVGSKSEAALTIKSIDLCKLNKKYCHQLVDLAIKAGIPDIKSYCLKLLKSNPDEVALQEAILKELKKNQTPKDLLVIYSSWLDKRTNEPVANYLYALALGDSINAKKYLEAALVQKPDFNEARIELAKIHIKRNDLIAAEKQLTKAIKLTPKNKRSRKLMAILKTDQGKGVLAIKEYSKFLSSTGVDESEKAVQLIGIAMRMKTAILVDKYLRQIKKDPKLSQEFRERNAERKLIFGGVTESDFSGKKTGKLRQYYIIYLFSKGKYSALIKLKTTKEEFPEFWKIYIMKRKNIGIWKSLAEKYYNKNKGSGDPAKLLIISMWLGKKTIEETEDQIQRISAERQGLVYAIVAEEYLRNKKSRGATIRFKKAMRARKSIYSGAIKQIYNSLTKR